MRRLAPPALLLFTAFSTAAFLGCPPASSLPLVGCAKDVDCKGARICERGACVDPHGAVSASSASPGKSEAPAAMQQGDVAAQQVVPPPVAAPVPVPIPTIIPAIVLPGASSMFHGDFRHTGRSRFKVPTSTPKERGRSITGGTVFSSPAITDEGVAIFGSHDRTIRAAFPDDAKPHGMDLRWTRPTGDMVWGSPALGPAPPGKPGAAPTVYIGSDDDKLYALDAATGEPRFTFTAGPCKRSIGFGPEAARCDVDGLTIGPDGTIFFVADGAYAIRPDGSLKWRFGLPTHCASAPAVGADGGVFFGCQDGRLYALSPEGQKRWDFKTGDDVDSAPAIGNDGTVYVGSDDNKLYAFSPGGALRWALKTGGDVRSSPAIAEDGTIYAGSFDNNLYAVHPDGTVAWTFSTADRVLGSPTIDAAGVIVFGSQDDRLYAVSPDGKLVWSVLLDGDVDATPAIGPGGAIYVGGDDKAMHVLR